jgi:hypothetical protein
VPFENHGNRSFTRISIQNNAPAASGVYGLSNSRGWIYIGETDNIQGELLGYLDRPELFGEGERPSGFTYELGSAENRIQRRNQLVVELDPAGNRSVEGHPHGRGSDGNRDREEVRRS